MEEKNFKCFFYGGEVSTIAKHLQVVFVEEKNKKQKQMFW